MKEKASDKTKYYRFLILSCVGLYMAMMAIKSVYVAEIATIIRVFNTNKSTASLMNTYYFITYALAQFLLGFLMHKLNVKVYLLITVPISVFTYIILSLFINEITQMWWLFLLNGFAQAGVVACTKAPLGKYLPSEYTAKANAFYTMSAGGGFALSYGLSAIGISFFSWRMPFLLLSGFFLVMLCLYIVSVRLTEKNCPPIVNQSKPVPETEQAHEGLIKLRSNHSVVLFIAYWMLICFFSGSVQYGVNNWLVSYLHEIFHFREEYSMLVTIVLQATTIVGSLTAISICKKRKNYLTVMIALYTPPIAIAVAMLFVLKVNLILSITLLLVFELFFSAGAVGVSVMLFDMRTQLDIGAASAFTNTSSSLAAGIVPTIVGALIETAGWRAQYVFVSCALAIVLLLYIILNAVARKQNQKEKKL